MEAFATAAAALSLAGLFNNCVECFDYIQLGRTFGRDFQTKQLRLDVAKVRLARWGQAMNINGNPRYSSTVQQDIDGDGTITLAKDLLGHILFLFVAAQKSSDKITGKNPADLVPFNPDSELDGSYKALHQRMRDSARSRQQRSNLLTKVSWALYRGRHLDNLVDDIHESIESLEKLLPAAVAANTLPLLAIEEVDSIETQDLPTLEEVIGDSDAVLRVAAENKLAAVTSGHRIEDADMAGDSTANVGNIYTDTAVKIGYQPTVSTSHSVGKFKSSDRARIHVGETYGSPSQWY